MKKLSVLFSAAVIAMSCLAGCGVDKEALEAVTVHLTNLETKVNSMYGKVEDMHSTGKMTEDLYMEFMDFSQGIEDALAEAEGHSPNVEELQESADSLETRVNSFVLTIDEMAEANKETLDRELVELSMACSELEDLMKNALENGKITQARMDEFYTQKETLDNLLATPDLEYSDDVKEGIKIIRSNLSVMASEINADNNLIDRLIDETKFSYNNVTESMTEEGDQQTDNEQAQTAAEETEKQPLSEDVQNLITNYLDFQTYAVAANADGTIDEDTVGEILECGVKLTYLKESVEQDGTTENNTIRANSIKADIYELAAKVGYEKANLFE